MWKVIAALGISLFAGIFIVANNTFAHNSFMSEIKGTQGDVTIPFQPGGFLVVDFKKHLVRQKGDTEILAFLVAPTGQSIQLKSIKIPEAKAASWVKGKGSTIIFPTYDVGPLLKLFESDVYALEIYVNNDGKSVQLPLIEVEVEKIENAGIMV